MEIYLVKSKKVEFKGPGIWDGEGIRIRKSTPRDLDIQLPPVEENSAGAQRFQEAFMKSLLENTSDEFKADLDYEDQTISTNLSVSLAFPFPPKLSWGHVKLFQRKEDKKSGCFILERLWNVFGAEVGVSFNFKGSLRGVPNSDICLEAKEMPIHFLGTGDFVGTHTHSTQTRLEAPQILASRWGNAEVLEGVLTLKIILNHESVSKLYLEANGKNELFARNKTLLSGAVGCDVVIFAGNGGRIKCHKAFLMVCSDVFRRIFEREMKETPPICINMPDTSEAGVRAFLAFIYHSDISAASKSCEIALELLRAAGKYEIASLDNAMKDLIGAKLKEWIGVDMAVRLLMYGKDLSEQDGMKALMKKTVQVIQWISKTDQRKLFESTEFKRCHGNPQTSMQLTALLFKFTESD